VSLTCTSGRKSKIQKAKGQKGGEIILTFELFVTVQECDATEAS
jgi:hypothetical protein